MLIVIIFFIYSISVVFIYLFIYFFSVTRSMGEFYPCHTKRTPPWEKKILDVMGKEMAEGWGYYNPKTCVIEDRNKGTEGRLADLARSFPRYPIFCVSYVLFLLFLLVSSQCLC